MLLPALLLVAQAGLVAVVPDGSGDCPSSKEVEETLYARVPGSVVPFSEAQRRGALRLTIAPPQDDGQRTLVLVGADGQTRLRRALGPGNGKKDCGALAETASLIVQRYLQTLANPASGATDLSDVASLAPVLSDRRWDLSAFGGWLLGGDAWGGMALGARVARVAGPVLIALSAGVTGVTHLAPVGMDFGARASARVFPVELGLWWRLPGRTELQAGAGAGLDIAQVRATSSAGGSQTDLLPGPLAFGAAAWRIPFRTRTFIRLSGMVAGALVTYRFTYRPQTRVDDLTIFSVPTRRIYVRMAADIGFTLR